MLSSVTNFLTLITIIYLWNFAQSQENGNKRPSKGSADISEDQNDAADIVLENQLRAYSIIYGLTSVANESLVTGNCLQDLRRIQRGVLQKQPWALKVLDASATKPSGFMFQHNFWLGSRETCAAANKPLRLTLSRHAKRATKSELLSDVTPFEVRFLVVNMQYDSPWQLELKFYKQSILHVGLCLPLSCDSAEIQQLTQGWIQRKEFKMTDTDEFNSKILYVKDLKLQPSFYGKSSLKLLVVLLIFTIVMVLSASCDCENRSAIIEEQSRATFTTEDHANGSAVKATPKKNVSLGRTFIKCFDIRRNYENLFAAQRNGGTIPVICGIRSVSAFCVIFVHVVLYVFPMTDNKPFLLGYLELKSLQLFNLPFLLVDAFFTISGFLQTFAFLKNKKTVEDIRANSFKRNALLFCSHLLHRYLRLAPLYFVTMALADLSSAYTNDVSLFHIYDRYDQVCGQYWWRNLFFIQSYYRLDELCLNWSWSLSCEMQFFIVGSFSMFTYAKYPKLVKHCVVLLLLLNIGWVLFKGINANFQFGFETFFLTADEVYINPLVRVTPYILGCMAAWYFTLQNCEIKVNPTLERYLWNLAGVLIIACAYTMYLLDLDYLAPIAAYLLGRIVMSLTICAIIIGSAMGRGSWWSRILETQIFQHINRLTYAMYLLNPLIIMLFASLTESSQHVDLAMFIVYCGGFSVITYLAALVFSLAFEAPYYNWSTEVLKYYKKKIN